MITRTFFANADAPVRVVFVKAFPATDLRFHALSCKISRTQKRTKLRHARRISSLAWSSRSADANTLQGPASLATCTSKLFAAACHSITTAFTRERVFSSSVKAIGPVPASAALAVSKSPSTQNASDYEILICTPRFSKALRLDFPQPTVSGSPSAGGDQYVAASPSTAAAAAWSLSNAAVAVAVASAATSAFNVGRSPDKVMQYLAPL